MSTHPFNLPLTASFTTHVQVIDKQQSYKVLPRWSKCSLRLVRLTFPAASVRRICGMQTPKNDDSFWAAFIYAPYSLISRELSKRLYLSFFSSTTAYNFHVHTTFQPDSAISISIALSPRPHLLTFHNVHTTKQWEDSPDLRYQWLYCFRDWSRTAQERICTPWNVEIQSWCQRPSRRGLQDIQGSGSDGLDTRHDHSRCL